MAECFKFFDLKSRIMTSFDTVPLDIDFGHLLTGSNYSDRLRVGGGVGDVDDNGNNDRDNGLGGGGGTEYYYGRWCENTVDSTVDDSIVIGEEEEDEDDTRFRIPPLHGLFLP